MGTTRGRWVTSGVTAGMAAVLGGCGTQAFQPAPGPTTILPDGAVVRTLGDGGTATVLPDGALGAPVGTLPDGAVVPIGPPDAMPAACSYDLGSDPDNCGSCGHACGVAETCTASTCTATSGAVDLLMVVDNSGSMKDNQRNIMSQFANLINKLTDPPCFSSTAQGTATTTTIPCRDSSGTANPDAVRAYAAVRDLRIGVISTDLGTQGFTVPGCLNPMAGDDGLLNPIANGGALAYHLPWMPTQSGASAAPPGFRPDGCTTRDQFPRWISFTSGNDVDTFARDFRCNAGLYINGCGLESQLESVWRALVWNGASLPDGTSDKPNAGFLRENAILAIIELTDEEDGSVQNCTYATNPNNPSDVSACDPVKSTVYDVRSSDWSSRMDPNLRFYTYPQAGGPQDPTWNLNRYIDPAHPDRGLLSLKPGHPERVIFTAITGVPLDLPRNADSSVNWDRLLGAPGAGGRDDFYGRVSDGDGAALTATTPEGPISMRLNNPDPTCSTRVVPACYLRNSTPTVGCPGSGGQYYAWPSRRVVEVARRFDQSPLCHGHACQGGFVTSICSTDYTDAATHIATLVARRTTGRL